MLEVAQKYVLNWSDNDIYVLTCIPMLCNLCCKIATGRMKWIGIKIWINIIVAWDGIKNWNRN